MSALVSAPLFAGSPASTGDLRAFTKLENGESATIVAYGTSLTEMGGWVDILRETLEERHPGQVQVINSGGSGQYSQWGVDNLDAKVIAHAPDLVFIEFSVNDCVARFGCSVDQARQNLESMIDRIQDKYPDCEFVLMSTSIADKYPEGHTSHRTQIEAYHQIYADVARERGFLFIDLFTAWQELKTSDLVRYEAAIPDTIHPSPMGEEKVVAPAILSALDLAR